MKGRIDQSIAVRRPSMSKKAAATAQCYSHMNERFSATIRPLEINRQRQAIT
jgi:hypothetical protein